MIAILLAPLTQNKITEFEQFTEVNRPRFDQRRKVVKSLKPQFQVRCVYHFATSALCQEL